MVSLASFQNSFQASSKVYIPSATSGEIGAGRCVCGVCVCVCVEGALRIYRLPVNDATLSALSPIGLLQRAESPAPDSVAISPRSAKWAPWPPLSVITGQTTFPQNAK